MDRAQTTDVLRAARGGCESARAALFSSLYPTLRRLARAQLARGSGSGFDTTELVHEAYLKLCDSAGLPAADRAHFLALCARAMRHILVDHFRSRTRAKRGGALTALELDEARLPGESRGEVLLALDEALSRFARLSDRGGRVVELKFFGGLSEVEIADELEVSVRTVSSEWRKARAWLARELRAE